MATGIARMTSEESEGGADYVVPVIHARVPASVGDGAFWAFVGVALAGVVDPPVAALTVGGFLVVRRRRRGRATGGSGQEVRTQARQARKVPGVTHVEGQLKGVVADAGDLPIANYDELAAEDVIRQLGSLSQIDLAKVDAYERRHDDRSTVRNRISSLRGDEPWPGYDDQTVVEIRKRMSGADDPLARQVSTYEARHKDRRGVLDVAEATLSDG